MRVPNLDEMIEAANEEYAKWYKYWEEYYEEAGVPRSTFMRESCKWSFSQGISIVAVAKANSCGRCN